MIGWKRNVSADDFKKQATSKGRLLNPQYGHVILVSERRVPLKSSKDSLSADVKTTTHPNPYRCWTLWEESALGFVYLWWLCLINPTLPAEVPRTCDENRRDDNRKKKSELCKKGTSNIEPVQKKTFFLNLTIVKHLTATTSINSRRCDNISLSLWLLAFQCKYVSICRSVTTGRMGYKLSVQWLLGSFG